MSGVRRIICLCVLLFTCSCFRCVATEREIQKEMYSPDKSLKFIAYESDGNVILKIYTEENKLTGTIITGIPMFQTRSVSWYKDNKILLKSTDVDLLITEKDNKWVPVPVGTVFSPDGKMIAVITWSRGDKKVDLTIGKPDELFSLRRAFDVLYRIPTNIELDELIDVLSWDKDDLIELRVKDKKYYWQKQKDNTWKQAF